MAHPYHKTGRIIDKLSHFVMHMIIIRGYILKYYQNNDVSVFIKEEPSNELQYFNIVLSLDELLKH